MGFSVDKYKGFQFHLAYQVKVSGGQVKSKMYRKRHADKKNNILNSSASSCPWILTSLLWHSSIDVKWMDHVKHEGLLQGPQGDSCKFNMLRDAFWSSFLFPAWPQSEEFGIQEITVLFRWLRNGSTSDIFYFVRRIVIQKRVREHICSLSCQIWFSWSAVSVQDLSSLAEVFGCPGMCLVASH